MFRDNLQQRMRGLAILPPPAGDEAPLFEHVCATVLQQSHLCPVPLEYQVGGCCWRLSWGPVSHMWGGRGSQRPAAWMTRRPLGLLSWL